MPAANRSSSGSGPDGMDALVEPIMKIGLFFAALMFAYWLAINVILPITLMNLAIIFAVLSVVFRDQEKIWTTSSLAGGFYLMLDMANGWTSAGFVRNVSQDHRWITAFAYLNAAAVTYCSWVLTRPLWEKAETLRGPDVHKGNLLKAAVAVLIAMSAALLPVTRSYLYFELPAIHHTAAR